MHTPFWVDLGSQSSLLFVEVGWLQNRPGGSCRLLNHRVQIGNQKGTWEVQSSEPGATRRPILGGTGGLLT